MGVLLIWINIGLKRRAVEHKDRVADERCEVLNQPLGEGRDDAEGAPTWRRNEAKALNGPIPRFAARMGGPARAYCPETRSAVTQLRGNSN